jgi:hypothetical protein
VGGNLEKLISAGFSFLVFQKKKKKKKVPRTGLVRSCAFRWL